MTAPETAIKSETADMDAGAPEVLPPTASDVALSSADADVPHPANADTHDAPAEPVAPSKRAARREKRRVIFEEKKERKKQQRKEQRATSQPAPEIDMSEDAVLRRRERTVAKRESYLMAAEEGVTVVIDCGFEDDMDSREKKSLSQQIMFSYGVNRRSPKPVSAYITSLSGETQENLTKISGFNEWLAFKATSKSYFELFKKESLVYLTADSPHTITHLSRDKVYIIGGIVDRNRLKGITYKKAVEQGIETGKLPLDQVVDMGVATRVLTVNHVFEILTQYAQQEDWASAALATLPSRKNVQLKQEEEQ